MMSLDVILIIVAGFIIAFVLAVGVGANDVANAFGTSVGAKVLTLTQACIIASIVETLGAVLLGTKVTYTVRKGIIDDSIYDNQTEVLVLGNIATLSGSCIWLILATVFKMPVSGTHSIIGATIGFSLVASGTTGINWMTLLYIVASWFVSPVLSGGVSVSLFYLCKFGILTRENPIEPGLRFLPLFYGITFVVNIFSIFHDGPSTFGFDRIPLWGVFVISLGAGMVVVLITRFALVPWQRKRIKEEVRKAKEQESEVLMVNETETTLNTQANTRIPSSASNGRANRELDSNVSTVSGNKKKGLPSHGSFPNAPEKVQSKDTKISFKPSSQNNLQDQVTINNPVKRERSYSMIASSSKNDEAEMAMEERRSRLRSRSESDRDANRSSLMFSRTINQLMNTRFLPADKKMMLNIEKRSAVAKERELKEEGREDSEIVQLTREMIDDRPEQRQLFSYLQILSAAFGGFAHGGNDVSNAIGPLVSIWVICSTPGWNSSASTPAPAWVLLFGGLGITIGLWVWGRRVIKTMGEDLAKITPSTGFCIELGAATTVLVASNLGLPISTTHCKVGSVVTVGRARAKKNVDWKLFRSIFLAWVLTLPVTGSISAAIMAILLQLPFINNPNYNLFNNFNNNSNNNFHNPLINVSSTTMPLSYPIL